MENIVVLPPDNGDNRDADSDVEDIRDEFTVKILHSSFCDTKIELRSSWCDLCSSFFCCVLEKKILELRDTFPAQPVQAILVIKKKDSSSAAAMK